MANVCITFYIGLESLNKFTLKWRRVLSNHSHWACFRFSELKHFWCIHMAFRTSFASWTMTGWVADVTRFVKHSSVWRADSEFTYRYGLFKWNNQKLMKTKVFNIYGNKVKTVLCRLRTYSKWSILMASLLICKVLEDSKQSYYPSFAETEVRCLGKDGCRQCRCWVRPGAWHVDSFYRLDESPGKEKEK